ncbi:porin family protein [Lacinutrix jangbogonensis]|uniref:porin family protein n=1 Tax=Lacinutrix jangbogonensis TaxID=1469557 RepID=UPI0009DE0EF4|nr:porin family protein [Lacinutrix jangbogonensis]
MLKKFIFAYLKKNIKIILYEKIILIAVFAMFSIYGFSQDLLSGVRVGYNISNLDFQPNVPGGIDNVHRNGFAIGFFVEYVLSDKVSFAPEIQFSAEGAKEKALRLDYIQLPLFFKMKVGEKLAIGLGPQVGLKVHGYEDGIQNFAFSGLAGAEYMITDEFFLDFRYNYGFTNIFDDDTNLKANNHNMQLGFGVKF